MTFSAVMGASGHGSTAQLYVSGTSYFSNVGLGRCGMESNGFTSRDSANQIVRLSGVISSLSWGVDSPFNGGLAIALAKNSISSALSVSISGTVTGTFTDSTHSVSVSIGDTICFVTNLLLSAGSVSYTGSFYCATAEFVTTSQNAQLLVAVGSSVNDVPTGSVMTYFNFLGVLGSGNITEYPQQFLSPVAGTLQNMACYISSNNSNRNCTFNSRVNSVNGSLSLSIASGCTGYFEDAVDNNSFSGMSLLDYGLIGPSGTSGNIILDWIGAHLFFDTLVTTSQCVIGGSQGAAVQLNSGDLDYSSLFGGGTVGTVSSPSFIPRATGLLPYAVTASGFTNFITAAKMSGGATFTLLKNGSSSGLAVSTSPGSTGYISDSAAVSILEGDSITNQISITGDHVTWASGSLLLVSD